MYAGTGLNDYNGVEKYSMIRHANPPFSHPQPLVPLDARSRRMVLAGHRFGLRHG
jgi:hypothetical protein